jgi:hypothetical protein
MTKKITTPYNRPAVIQRRANSGSGRAAPT